jgi:hypothetical protein
MYEKIHVVQRRKKSVIVENQNLSAQSRLERYVVDPWFTLRVSSINVEYLRNFCPQITETTRFSRSCYKFTEFYLWDITELFG